MWLIDFSIIKPGRNALQNVTMKKQLEKMNESQQALPHILIEAQIRKKLLLAETAFNEFI